MENLKILKTSESLKELKTYLADKDFIALDVETTGVIKDSVIIGFSVASEIDLGFYVITHYWDVGTQTLLTTEVSKEDVIDFMKSLIGKNLIGQNFGFDAAMIEDNYGVNLMPSLHTDTLVLGHLLNENRLNGLKERGVELYGEDARAEQNAMKESVAKNGGQMTKTCYELYKADADLIAQYGAKDAILTLKVFYNDVPILFEEGLDKFFYEDETMPLLRGPTYDMNRTGLRIDPTALQDLKSTLIAECAEKKSFILKEIEKDVKAKYPGTSKAKTFNIGSGQMLSWLLFVQLGNDFNLLTKGGKELCKALDLKLPYAWKDKAAFIDTVKNLKGQLWRDAAYNRKTKKMGRPAKVADYWTYFSCGKETLTKLAGKYKWVQARLDYAKSLKLLNTYVEGIQEKTKYGIVRPSFIQHGTTSGRYSCKAPNFQNLPRDDKRIKACIIARPGKVFVGADHSQLEPRCFASISGDERLKNCFATGDDFYSVIGTEVFNKTDCTLKKADKKNGFAAKYPHLRDISKVVGLSATYGTTAPKMSSVIGKSIEDTQLVIDNYFESFPDVKKFQLDTHAQVKSEGVVRNIFGRPRRMPQALTITEIYGKTPHKELPYAIRNILNLAVNHIIQSSGASIMNRGAIMVWKLIQELTITDQRWTEVKVVMQCHDSLILEGPTELAEDMSTILKHGMENACSLPGVALEAEPKIGNNLAEV